MDKFMNSKVAYPIIILKNKKEYLVNVPDLKLFTEGKSLVEAMEMARDVIGLHCMDVEDRKMKLPDASSHDVALKICKKENPEYANGTMTMVDVDISKFRKNKNQKMAWDPDFTKLTEEEKKRLDEADAEYARGEYVEMDI